MNYMLPKSGSLWIIGRNWFLNISTYRGEPIVCLKKIDPTLHRLESVHQTVTRSGCRAFSIAKWGFSVPQMSQFCLFTYPSKLKWASSLHQSILKSNWSLSIISTIVFANSKYWILYWNSCRSATTIYLTLSRLIPTCCAAFLINVWGSSIKNLDCSLNDFRRVDTHLRSHIARHVVANTACSLELLN